MTGLEIKLERVKLRATQKDLAEASNVSCVTISKIETGGNFNISTLEKIKKGLELLPALLRLKYLRKKLKSDEGVKRQIADEYANADTPEEIKLLDQIYELVYN